MKEQPDPSVIAGRQPVLEALKAGRSINRLLLARDSGRHSLIAEILNAARTRHIPVDLVSRLTLDRTSGGIAHQGVVALASAKEYATIDELLSLPVQRGEAPFFCVLDGIEDPHNLGAILRTCCATGAHGLVTRSRRAAGLTATVGKTSAGAMEYVPVARVSNIAYCLKELQRSNVWVVGIDAGGERFYTEVDYRDPVAIVVGGEGTGLSNPVLHGCDMVVRIPMLGQISSLNASVAAAIVLYEVFRSRGW